MFVPTAVIVLCGFIVASTASNRMGVCARTRRDAINWRVRTNHILRPSCEADGITYEIGDTFIVRNDLVQTITLFDIVLNSSSSCATCVCKDVEGVAMGYCSSLTCLEKYMCPEEATEPEQGQCCGTCPRGPTCDLDGRRMRLCDTAEEPDHICTCRFFGIKYCTRKPQVDSIY